MAQIQITETVTTAVEIPDYFEGDDTVRGRLVDLLFLIDGFQPGRKGAPELYRDYLAPHRQAVLQGDFSTGLAVADPKRVIAELRQRYDEADRILEFMSSNSCGCL